MSMEDKINHLKKECAELRQENVDLREHLTIMYVDKYNKKVKLERKADLAFDKGFEEGAYNEWEAHNN